MIDQISRAIAALKFELYRPEIQGPFSIDYREPGCHAQSVYPTYTSSMGTAIVKPDIIFIGTRLRAVLSQYKLFKDRNTRDYLAWTIRERGCHARGVYTWYLAHGNSKGEAKEN